jgi:hypothetical protein
MDFDFLFELAKRDPAKALEIVQAQNKKENIKINVTLEQVKNLVSTKKQTMYNP